MSSPPNVADNLAEPILVSRVDRLVTLPYRLVRPPLAVIDEHAIKKLPRGNPVRELYHAALRLADGIARVDRPRSSGADEPMGGSATGSAPTDESTTDTQPDKHAEERAEEQADEQRHQEFEAKVDRVTRSNHSPAKMARELAMVRAAEEAREHEASDAEVGEPAD